ncbi:MAG: hypothetical protein KIS92_02515 [Planctomycetota bacterium]|nr:hypothetical protein [Planctomycetota bacterium]
MRIRAWSGLAGLFAVLAFGLSARDTVDGPHGAENVRDRLQAQGNNLSADRARGWWAQDDANMTGAANADWMSVTTAIAYAKKTWNVTIVDETGDAAVGGIKFCCAVGDLGKEYALPVFLEALAMAVEGARQDCYVERDLDNRGWDPKNYWRGKVHIRKARPLQPAPDEAAAPAKKEEPKKDEPKKTGDAAPALEKLTPAGGGKEQASAE